MRAEGSKPINCKKSACGAEKLFENYVRGAEKICRGVPGGGRTKISFRFRPYFCEVPTGHFFDNRGLQRGAFHRGAKKWWQTIWILKTVNLVKMTVCWLPVADSWLSVELIRSVGFGACGACRKQRHIIVISYGSYLLLPVLYTYLMMNQLHILTCTISRQRTNHIKRFTVIYVVFGIILQTLTAHTINHDYFSTTEQKAEQLSYSAITFHLD